MTYTYNGCKQTAFNISIYCVILLKSIDTRTIHSLSFLIVVLSVLSLTHSHCSLHHLRQHVSRGCFHHVPYHPLAQLVAAWAGKFKVSSGKGEVVTLRQWLYSWTQELVVCTRQQMEKDVQLLPVSNKFLTSIH